VGEIQFTNYGEVAHMILNNPSARNAMSLQMMEQFSQIVHDLEQNTPRIIYLTGSGNKAFCSGGDLRDVRSTLIEKGKEMSVMMNQLTSRLTKLPTYIIVGVEGAAVGGGAELVTLGDWVIANKNARIQFLQAPLGVTTGWGGGGRLLKKCPQKAIHLLLGGSFSMDCLQRWGVVDQIVETDHVHQACQNKIQELLAIPECSMRGMLELSRHPEREIEIFTSLWGGDVHRHKIHMN
jgi:enoyl-CoA hydratase/carnithine racemase